ncbi:MAG: insulinase family protein [Alphaproteobacteria bacterium]|nr:insulinase family protein [Alphaproteobacteria bacterium]
MIQIHRLKNGIRVVTDTNPDTASVSLGVWVAVGARFETPDINGISHVLEHMAFKGTTTRSAFDISREIEDVGGIVNAYTGKDMTAYYVKVLKKDWQLGLDIISDILQHSVMDKDELAREQGVIVQEINMSNDTPDDLIFDLYNQVAYPDQPLGRTILGTPENVRSVTSQKLLDYMHHQYTTDRLIISVAGDIDVDDFLKKCEESFTEITKKSGTSAEKARYVGGEIRKSKKNEQVNLILGFEGYGYTDKDYYTAALLASVFGGGMSSRLFQEIREKRGLVYSIYAFNSPETDTGTFGVYAGTGEAEVAELLPVLCDEINRLPDTLDDVEILRAKNRAKARLLMRSENHGTHAESNAIDMIIHGRVVPDEEAIAKIDAVTKQDMACVARQIFAGRPTLASLGPISQVPLYDSVLKRLNYA